MPDQNAHVLAHDRANLVRFDYLTREDWLKARRQYVTSTDIGALSGLPGFASPLSVYADKVGGSEDPDDEDASERMLIGKLFQSPIGAAYQIVRAKREGVMVELDYVPDTTLFVHARHKRHATSLDIWQTLRGSVVPLECKNTGAYPEQPYDTWLTQVQWQMWVTGSEMATITAMCGGDTIRWWDIDRDDEVIAVLAANADEFLEKHLDPAVPPPSDGTEWSRKAMRQLYPTSDDGAQVELTNEDLDAALRAGAIGDEIKGLEQQKAQLEDGIKQKMGLAATAFLPNGWKVSWKSFNKEGYFVKPCVVRPFRITKPKEGKR